MFARAQEDPTETMPVFGLRNNEYQYVVGTVQPHPSVSVKRAHTMPVFGRHFTPVTGRMLLDLMLFAQRMPAYDFS